MKFLGMQRKDTTSLKTRECLHDISFWTKRTIFNLVSDQSL